MGEVVNCHHDESARTALFFEFLERFANFFRQGNPVEVSREFVVAAQVKQPLFLLVSTVDDANDTACEGRFSQLSGETPAMILDP